MREERERERERESKKEYVSFTSGFTSKEICFPGLWYVNQCTKQTMQKKLEAARAEA